MRIKDYKCIKSQGVNLGGPLRFTFNHKDMILIAEDAGMDPRSLYDKLKRNGIKKELF